MAMSPALSQLFNQAIEHSTSEGLQQTQPMTEERRAFLEAAIKEVTYDVIGKMREYVATLGREGAAVDDLVEALEGLQFECERIDASNDLPKIGGVEPVLALLGHGDADVRMHAAWVIGTTLQQNPEMQSLLLERGVLPQLLRALSTEPEARVTEKLLMTVSAFVRHHAAALAEFARGDGHAIVVRLLASQSVRTRRKAAFLLSWLLNPEEQPPAAEPLWRGVQQAFSAEAAVEPEPDADVVRYLLDCVPKLAQLTPAPNVREIRAAITAAKDRLGAHDDILSRAREVLEGLQ